MNAIGQRVRVASVNDWAKFLAPLVAAVRNRPDASEFTPFCAACADALAIPVEWLTPAKRRDAMAKFAFWPSVADVSDLFADNKRHAMDMAAYRSPAGYLPAPEPPKRLDDTQLASVMAKVAELRTDLAANITRDAPKAAPIHLTMAQLLASYEQAAARGNSAAAYRADQLRKALAA